MSNRTQFKKKYLTCDITYLIKKYVNRSSANFLTAYDYPNAFELENGVTMFPMANFCFLVLHETFAYEDSSKTFAKSFDSFAQF